MQIEKNYNPERKTFSIDYERVFSAYESMAYEIMEIEKTGDYERAKKFLAEWTKIPLEIKDLISRIDDVPLEVHPVFKV